MKIKLINLLENWLTMVNKIILDTDIGSDIDDAYALVFALNSPEIEIKAIITNNSNVRRKAQIAREFTEKVPIFSGIEKDKGVLTTTIGNREYDPRLLEDNLDFFKNEEVIYVSIGALSNLALFLEKGVKFKKVIIMGGSINIDYKGREKKVPEWNLNCDINATKKIFNSNLDILLVPLDVTWNLELSEEQIERIKSSNKQTSILLTTHLQEMREFLFRKFNINSKKPVLHDPLAVYASFSKSLFSLTKMRLSIDERGLLNIDKNGKDITVVNRLEKGFIDFFLERILK